MKTTQQYVPRVPMCIYIHVQSASSADVAATDELVSVVSQLEPDVSSNSQMKAE